jgi:hypothetical protein
MTSGWYDNVILKTLFYNLKTEAKQIKETETSENPDTYLTNLLFKLVMVIENCFQLLIYY